MVSVTVSPYDPTITVGPAQPLPQPLTEPPLNAPVAMPQSTTTLFAKGGAPVQATPDQERGYGLLDRLYAAQRQQQQAVKDEGGAGWAMADAWTRQHANNLLALPSVAADIATAPYRNTQHGVFGFVPKLSVEKTVSGVRGLQGLLAGQDPREAYNRSMANLDIAKGAIEEAHPWATTGGSIGGDITSLIGARLPFVSGPSKEIPAIAETVVPQSERMVPGMSRWMTRKAESLTGTFTRPVGKILETGGETAALAILNENDPINSAALAAGGQASGSLALLMARHPGKTAIAALGGGFIAYSAVQRAFPGGENRWGEALSHTLDKMWIAGLVGLTASMTGAGRYRGSPFKSAQQFSEDLPRFADGVNVAFRAPAASVWVRAMKEDVNSRQPVIGPVLNSIMKNPDAFSEQELMTIGKSFEDGSLKPTIDKMIKDEAFRTKVGL